MPKLSRRGFLRKLAQSVPAVVVPPLVLRDKPVEPVVEQVVEKTQVINEAVEHMMFSHSGMLTSWAMSDSVDHWFPGVGPTGSMGVAGSSVLDRMERQIRDRFVKG